MHKREPTTQTLNSGEARQQWSQLLDKVFRREARVIVEKSGVPVAAIVKAAFRLDSVTTDGDFAFLSMRGSLAPSQDGIVPAGTYTGTVTGRMIVDRRRGWFSETAFQVLMRSAMLPVPASPDTIHLRLRLTQHMVVTDKR